MISCVSALTSSTLDRCRYTHLQIREITQSVYLPDLQVRRGVTASDLHEQRAGNLSASSSAQEWPPKFHLHLFTKSTKLTEAASEDCVSLELGISTRKTIPDDETDRRSGSRWMRESVPPVNSYWLVRHVFGDFGLDRP